MSGKQMEGGNRERRRKAVRARRKGSSASARGETKGASKQRYDVPKTAEHEQKLAAVRRGKVPHIRQATPDPDPGRGRSRQYKDLRGRQRSARKGG